MKPINPIDPMKPMKSINETDPINPLDPMKPMKPGFGTRSLVKLKPTTAHIKLYSSGWPSQ